MYKVDSAAEPDLVRCYFCLRELDGWEVSDEPWDEHKRKPCPFIAKGKRARDLTLQDFLELEFERVVINYVSVSYSGNWELKFFLQHVRRFFGGFFFVFKRQSLKDEEVELGKEAAVIKASIEDMTKPVKKPRARKRKY